MFAHINDTKCLVSSMLFCKHIYIIFLCACFSSEVNSRPSSAASTLSSSSEWAVPNPLSELLQFEVEIKFNIPDIVITPSLALVQSAVNDVATCLVDVCKDIQWWAIDTRETLYQSISQNSAVGSLVRYISDVVTCKYQDSKVFYSIELMVKELLRIGILSEDYILFRT